ncbi:uncharacterized protein M6B38_401100 [Iris pallida]|uniref:Activator of Hsp90 ATPase AHSA1-like N-terminal domain-containing protein n=1 Tax=Iris pallida TaxID=29817 RepID=A0AAX6FU84_IRIPA|nr:uncharacterized protein M6B38_401100 [Iris pallida]
MEKSGGGGVVVTEEKKSSSYRYWVREPSSAAPPPPAPRKLTPQDVPKPTNAVGSVWNQAGTWEEKNLNSWASNRIKELLSSLGSLEFSGGNAVIDEVSNCSGDAFLVTVRNKKRVGYTYELTLKFKGEWLIKEERRKIRGHLDIPEFSFGELDDLQIESRLSEGKDLSGDERLRIRKDLRLFLAPVREKLLEFERELKDR